MENDLMNPRMIALIRKLQSLKSTSKTKADIVKEGIYKLVGGIVFWIVLFLLAASAGGFEKLFGYLQGSMVLLGLVGIVLLFGAPIWGLGQIVFGLLSHQRREICPFCSQEITVLSKVRSSVCTKCGRLLHFSVKSNPSEMAQVECPVCKNNWGMAKDLEAIACQTCGHSIAFQGDTPRLLSADGQCPSCKKPIQKQAFFCPSCGQLLTQPSLACAPFRPNTEVWASGIFEDNVLQGYLPKGMIREGYLANTSSGYLIQAVWLTNTIHQELEKALEEKKPVSFFTFMNWLGRLDRMIAHLDFALELKAAVAPVVQQTFADADLLIGIGLKQAVDWATGNFAVTVDSKSLLGFESKIRKYLLTVSETHNGFLGKLKSLPTAKNASSTPEEWNEPVLNFNRRNAGNDQCVFITDNWKNATEAKWLNQVAKMNLGDSLPAIRVPKSILAELSTGSLLSQKA